MKTINKILILLLIVSAFASCNTGRNYANYRVGGKSPKKETLENTFKKNSQGKNRTATLEIIPINDTLQIKNNNVAANDAVEADPNKKEKFVTNNVIRGKIQNMVVGMRKNSERNKITNISLTKSTFQGKSKIKNIKADGAIQKYGTDTEDILYFLFGALLIAGGILALLAAGVSIAEIIIYGLGLIGFLILLYYIGEAFMNIFPGMSYKK